MKRIKTLLVFAVFASLLSLVVVACTNNEASNTTDTTTKADSSIIDTSTLGTRTVKKKVAAKAYYYKSLASFEKGKVSLELEDLASLADKKVSLVVLYEANAPWAQIFSSGEFSITGDDHLNGLMESYNLQIIQQFAIDDANEGIVMEPKEILEDPIEAAREVSMVEHVLMVHVKEVPESTSTAIADTEK
ncbi:hypothetical protein [Aureispira sp. CCB-QB1]|uniref:hypothetical protein n=1 Tax=Aureispira sp. CCB-QB1 TaxID=1313421 RepID=UPI0006970E14|nr:hypothetical protein [Aureispira sp. CCB-QB1]